jgi:hypothetical protein
LRAETLASIETTEQKIQAYGQVAEAGKRSLKFISAQMRVAAIDAELERR